ncbi:hypothetical protein CBS101457_001325 [Exobasidium rhododendri]|nr:hypothetical protein CBS101457_001325 [Exobasidium rhododendri]
MSLTSESPGTNAEEVASPSAPLRHNIHLRHHTSPPPHHVVTVSGQAGLLNHLPSIPYLYPTSHEDLYSSTRTSVFVDAGPAPQDGLLHSGTSTKNPEYVRTGFCNPWTSWHKPALGEIWNGLSWGSNEKQTRMVETSDVGETEVDDLLSNEETQDRDDIESKAGLCADLKVVEPVFGDGGEGVVQATWLGHASVLLELPALHSGISAKPLRLLFDPIFSMRCSPTQYFGPMRYYPPPCSLAALPPIDIVFISHSHYDHLDYDTIVQLWHANRDHLQFFVPLGNREWFLSLNIGIEEDRVTELDWWDETWLDQKSGKGKVDKEEMLRVVCTPSQHGSGRYGIDASRTLWCSWTLEHISQGSTYRVFFGGDTGFQFHSPASQVEYPTCPAFTEIVSCLGKPDLSFLPISVGASFDFIKSYDWLGVVPQLDQGLTAANHLTPSDAVRVAKIMRGYTEGSDKGALSPLSGQGVVVAIHWGTFVSGLQEVRTSMQDLYTSCESQGANFVRNLDARNAEQLEVEERVPLVVACLDHGQSIYLDLKSEEKNLDALPPSHRRL